MWECGGEQTRGPQLGQGTCGSSLLRLLSSKGQALQAAPDGTLRFVARQGSVALQAGFASTSGGGGTDVWLLAAAGAPGSGRYTLREAGGSCRFLTAVTDGHLVLSEAPEVLHLFMDLDRRVVLRLPGKTCLQSGSDGAALAGRVPLGRARASKLFSLEEAALPPHSLQPWPLRAALRVEQAGGGYLSASACGLAAAAPVACCSEEWTLALGQGAPLSLGGAGGGNLVAPGSSVWTGDGRRLLSADIAGSGQVALAPQHACTGGERFTLLLSKRGKLALLAEPAAQQRQQVAQQQLSAGDAAGGQEAAGSTPAAVAVHQGCLTCRSGGGKPSQFALELASHKPTLLLTAHGQLLSCSSRGSDRPCGVLPPAPAGTAGGGGAASVCAQSALAHAWQLEHHGDSVYSLRHAASGRSLCVDDLGVPCFDTPGGAASLVYPDDRLLFWAEPGWATLEATGSSSSTSTSGMQSSAASNSGSGGGGSGAASAAAEHGFVQPAAGSSLTVAGFSLRSVALVAGRHLYLSVLPDGLVTSVSAAERPSTWELFSIIDYQTLVKSPLRLLDRLPCAPAASPAPDLRRAASMQALSSSGCGSGTQCSSPLAPGGRRCGSHGQLPRTPSLPAVQEHQPQGDELEHPGSAEAKPLQQQLATDRLPPRRSQSDSALAELQGQVQARRQRPQWLAQLLHQPGQAEGWGVRSAATLQQLACRQLCVSLVQQQHGRGRQLTPGLVTAVEEELSAHLPEEVAASIGRELRLLAEPPAPTKLSLPSLGKAASVASGGGGNAPAWMQPWVEEREMGNAALMGWPPTEAFLCRCCCSASGALLPLDPYINPRHYLFLAAMQRRARGGGRVRLRARRRLDREDPVVAALKAGRLILFAWAAARTVGALLSS